MNTNELTMIFKALSDDQRFRIIEMLAKEEMCACKLLEHFNFSQPTLSHHMKLLLSCNLVNCRKDGKWSYYSINIETYNKFTESISNLIPVTSFKKDNKKC
ncbi:MAG: ArsR/SmtB family transcription factor [Anaerorhabdus sp.]